MIIPIIENRREVIDEGRFIFENNPLTYTQPTRDYLENCVKKYQQIGGGKIDDSYDLIYASIYDYCMYGVRLDTWFQDEYFGKSHSEKLALAASRQKASLLSEAKEKFAAESPAHGSLEDYERALDKYVVSYSEYMHQYDFWRLTDEQRNEFISRYSALQFYRRAISPDIKLMFTDKFMFLNKFRSFVHRDYMLVSRHSFEEFKRFVAEHDCIAKPLGASSGAGIRKLKRPDTEPEAEALYGELKADNYLLEECVANADEIRAFHPDSLNTIRIVTLSNSEECRIFKTFIRTGVHGSVIDNAHTGGIVAQINIEKGFIESDGIDLNGNIHVVHPDTGKAFKGTRIPQWDKIIDTVKQACRVNADIHIAGWDIALLPGGVVEIIEGNYGPDFDGGMQIPLKKGIRKELVDNFTEMFEPHAVGN